ncbi:alpha/beta hydrolase [Nocardioides sp. J2M5]|uniref:alpha/beta hydrolase n=1 Tax=Nocardioides palaemonis TaxID=2829810 RepID=UPI001BAB98EB|nr:alpha/beta fold hydrolase [Nocardioides palaemonis]MBS2939213.1 alpha/beta hydrolase [Nocardioides palaemonis]
MSTARLVPVRAPSSPDGVVLVLHGGAAREGRTTVSPAQLSVLRMVPVARRIARAGRRRLAVHRLLNSHRGWDSRTTPVMDVARALERMQDLHGDLPVALVGHSLGGRAALLASGGDLAVRAAVALNPWLHPTDQVHGTNARVLVVHGTDDRIARPGLSEDLVRRAPDALRIGRIAVGGGRHAMLRRARTYESLTADFVTAVLLGSGPRSEAVAAVLAGERSVEV